MNYKKLLVGAMAFSLIAVSAGCEDNKKSNGNSENFLSEDNNPKLSYEQNEKMTDSEAVPDPPVPAEATDPNTVSFDDEDFSFASVITDDETSARGELSIAEFQGNKMLKYTDLGETFENGLIQKIRIDVKNLLSPENIEKVYCIEFDVYADAVSDKLETEDGSFVKAPGWIGGGGGTVVADEKTWYNFGEFGGEEYFYEMSGPCHVVFKFLLAASGKKWSAEMSEPNFLIMRWGLQNDSNLYIDNITFYDSEGNSLPLL